MNFIIFFDGEPMYTVMLVYRGFSTRDRISYLQNKNITISAKNDMSITILTVLRGNHDRNYELQLQYSS